MDELSTVVNFVFRIGKQESSFHEERLVKIEEWQTMSAPLEQLFSEQGSKWEDDDEVASGDLETLRKYKQATQVGTNRISSKISHELHLKAKTFGSVRAAIFQISWK
jgi:hypothetical protein